MLGEDDLLLPNYLTEMLRSAISQQGCALVHPRVEIINSEGVLILPITDLVKRLIFGTMQISHSFRHLRRKSERYYNGQEVIPWVLLGNFFYFPTIFWNSKIVKSIGFSESYQIALDLDLLLQITAQNKKIVFTDLTLAQYRRHARSISNNPLNMIPRLEEERLLSHQFAKQSGVGVFNSFLSILRLTSRFHALTLWISSFVRLRLPTAIKFFIAALRY
jgi:hypothetical protein